MPDLVKAREMVARVVDHLGDNAGNARLNDNAWAISRGSATGFVGLVQNPRDEELSLIVVAMNVMDVPAESATAIYRRLLELNFAIRGRASFALSSENQVVLIASRLLQDLDESELVDLVYQTAELADEYDDRLKDEFERPMARTIKLEH